MKKIDDATNSDKEDRRLLFEQRRYTYSYYLPDRRSGWDRRKLKELFSRKRTSRNLPARRNRI
ncbi:MAG: hypothetical protein HKM93_14090 [Desulfobacteraceae bacterium]|nr:hypothetical protein [Desulfobacteraceae bacterium]